MQGEYLIDTVHNIALQIGPLPGDRVALIERLKRIGFVQRSKNEVNVNSAALFAAPAILKKMALALGDVIKLVSPDFLCGASPIGTALATHLCIETQTPLLVHGKQEERVTLLGDYFSGQSVLIMDDLFFSVEEIFATTCLLRNEGLRVTDAALLLDAGEKSREQLAQFGIRLHALFSVHDFGA